MSDKDKYRNFFADERAALYLQEQEELARKRLIKGDNDAYHDLDNINWIENRMKKADEMEKQINRYRRLLAAAKESVSELLNDSEI